MIRSTVSHSIILACLLFFTIRLQAQYADKPEYSFFRIDKDLLEDVRGIYQIKQGNLKIIDEGNAVLDLHIVATVLNEDGRDLGELLLSYDSFRKIQYIKGNIYDRFGAFIRSAKNAEIKDYAAYAGYSGYADTRIKKLDLMYNEYPYTVEFDIGIKFDGYINLPEWTVLFQEKLAVMKSKFVIEAPLDFSLEFYLQNTDVEPTIVESKRKRIYTWEANNVTTPAWENFAPPKSALVKTLYVKPLVYEIDGWEGFTTSWKDMGYFFHELNDGRDQLSAEEAYRIQRKISGNKSREEKCQILYQYLQDNTRYVSIQLGIGGWQCLDAEFVHKHKYGDCKALVNYMQCLLNIAGIESYPVLIYAGKKEKEIKTDFPSNQFNHVILCVPNQTDTLWLECTSQHIPFGYLGRFTANRHALLCGPDGGVLVKTPSFEPADNLRQISGNLEIDREGNATFTGSISFHNYQFEAPLHVYHTYDEQETLDWFQDFMQTASVSIQQLEFKPPGSDSIKLDFELEMAKLASKTYNRLFLYPKIFDRKEKLGSFEERYYPVFNNYPYIDKDSVIIQLPDGFEIESMHDYPVKTECSFGSYYADCRIMDDGKKLLYTSSVKLNSFNSEPDTYQELYDFFLEVSNCDQRRIVLKKLE